MTAMIHEGMMSWWSHHDLAEALEDLDRVSDLLTSCPIPCEAGCDAGIAVYLEHVLDHLCRSWHRRRATMNELESESQEHFELLCQSVPNWESRFSLVEIPYTLNYDTESRIIFNAEFGPASLSSELIEARRPLEALLSEASHAEFSTNEVALEHALAELLSGICRGWHLSHIEPEDVPLLNAERLTRISGAIPHWNWFRKIVPTQTTL